MSGPRIGDRELALPAGPPATRPSGRGQRLGAALASPAGILLVVPGLVAAVGLVLTWLGQSALRESTSQLGRDRFAEQTDFIARDIAASLSQADPMLDHLRELAATWSPSAPPGPVAHALRGLMGGRAGIAYASVSYPDGTFQGTYLDEDRVIRFKEARRTPSGIEMTTFDLGENDRLVQRTRRPSSYDPRTRDFYRLAVERGERVWTAPYPFFDSHQTGVTRTEAVREATPPRALRAVLTADFDVHALSASMAQTPIAGARTLLYTRDGTLLAYPEGAAALARIPFRKDRPISHADLGDPVVTGFFARAQGGPSPAGAFTQFSAGGDTWLAMVRPVPRFPDLGWSVAAIVPRDTFFRAPLVHARQSLLVATFCLLAALGVAVVFARHVVHVRRDAALARDLARQATDRARELGSYRLIERLGAGGMGEVWRAEHRLLVRQAAIKLIREEALGTGPLHPTEVRERFKREAQTLATLRSRHTIQLFDYGVSEDGTFYIVMELLDGMDLETLVGRYGAQPASRVIQWLLQVCSSLAEAHDAGLVHRDIKPANIFVCRAADELDVVKVLDFGLVHAANQRDVPGPPGAPIPTEDPAAAGNVRLTQAGQNLGTPAFMAPEQVRGQETDGRADLYSLGCVAIWLLSGRMPFESASPMGLMGAHLYSPLPDLAPLVPGPLPPALDRILRQCLEKSREARPRDARALAEALRAIEPAAGAAWTPDRARAWWETHGAQSVNPA